MESALRVYEILRSRKCGEVKNNSKQALNLYIVADRDLSCYSNALSKLSAEPECGAHVNDVLEIRRSRAFASCPDARLSNVFLT